MAKSSLRQLAKITLYILGLGALATLLYWLLPVAVQSRLSADHVRYVFAASDPSPVAGDSLSSLWILLLKAMKLAGLGVGAETFATSAALSGWIAILALAILATYARWPALFLVALTPAVLWTAVVPNGMVLSLLVLALMGSLSRPSYAFHAGRSRRDFLAAFVEGLGCALTLAAWLLVFVRAVRVRHVQGWWIRENRMRLVLFLAGFSLPYALGFLIADSAHFPVVSFLRAMRFEDSLGAAAVISGGGGELTLALLASLSFAVAILISNDWSGQDGSRVKQDGLSRRLTWAKWGLLATPFFVIVLSGRPMAWRLAHPGWNTVLEDFAKNVAGSFSVTAVAIVRTPTEEAGLRFVDALLEKSPKLAVFRPVNLFEPSTRSRIAALEPRFEVGEAEVAAKAMGDAGGFKVFVDDLIFPNVKRGVQFWIDAFPERADGLEIQFLGNGFRVRDTDGSSKVITDREALRGGYVRARPTYVEYLAGPSIETTIFERYAVYHLAVARAIESEKRTTDWDRRARGEYYAALKKVDWLEMPYEKVCTEPAKQASSEAPATSSTPEEPLDVCIETRGYHSSRK